MDPTIPSSRAVTGAPERARDVLTDRAAWAWYEQTLVDGVGRAAGRYDCGGLQLDEDTRVWCSAWWDLDHEEAFLLEVTTRVLDEHGHTEVVDYLACWSRHSDAGRVIDLGWQDRPRLFFDRDDPFLAATHQWFVTWMFAQRARARAEPRSRPVRAELRKRQRQARRDDRARAARQGVRFEDPSERT